MESRAKGIDKANTSRVKAIGEEMIMPKFVPYFVPILNMLFFAVGFSFCVLCMGFCILLNYRDKKQEIEERLKINSFKLADEPLPYFLNGKEVKAGQ